MRPDDRRVTNATHLVNQAIRGLRQPHHGLSGAGMYKQHRHGEKGPHTRKEEEVYADDQWCKVHRASGVTAAILRTLKGYRLDSYLPSPSHDVDLQELPRIRDKMEDLGLIHLKWQIKLSITHSRKIFAFMFKENVPTYVFVCACVICNVFGEIDPCHNAHVTFRRKCHGVDGHLHFREGSGHQTRVTRLV